MENSSDLTDRPERSSSEPSGVRVFQRVPRAAWGRAALAATLGLLVGSYAIVFMAFASSGKPIHMDFFGIWGWAQFATEQPPARIYDHAALEAFLLSLDPEFPVPMPFPYPPLYLLLIRPLGWLSYPVAQAIWSGVTLLAYVAALSVRQARLWTTLLALLAPATAVNLLYGQNGFLTAALLVGGIRLAPSRPVLGGILLGLLSYKPQFGILVAIALAAAALWRVMLAAAVTVAVITAASLLVFGAESWMAWFHSMPGFATIVYENRAHLLRLMPTALSDALALGASERLAVVIQATVVIAAAAGVWFAFRRASGKAPAAALAVASVLASPYAFVYDLTLVAAAVTLVAAEYRMVLSTAEMLILATALLLPIGMVMNVVLPAANVVNGAATVVNGAVFALIMLRLSTAPAVPRAQADASTTACRSAKQPTSPMRSN